MKRHPEGTRIMRKDTVPYNTNLAAEFWVLSALYRLGVEAHLTLGNKKAIDILIVHNNRCISTVDVKGLADRYDWPADNIKVLNDPKHFYIFLSFEGKISDPLASPSVWIIPSNQLKRFIKHYKTRAVVKRTLVEGVGSNFKNAWWQFSVKGVPPPPYHVFYGELIINDSPAPTGTTVEARGEGVRTGIKGNPIETTTVGEYSSDFWEKNQLIIKGNIQDGTIITFYVNGESTGQTAEWYSGRYTQLNLTV